MGFDWLWWLLLFGLVGLVVGGLLVFCRLLCGLLLLCFGAVVLGVTLLICLGGGGLVFMIWFCWVVGLICLWLVDLLGCGLFWLH